MPRRHRPTGQHTRGKTAENRLRQVDVYVALALADTLRAGEPLAVDLGFGARPWTALEMAERLARVNPRVRVLGVEIDPERVADARPFADPPRVDFVLGGFNLERVIGDGTARLIRAYNVLRQYDEADVDAAIAQIAQALEPGGVLIEGTSNPTGAMVAFDVWRKPTAAGGACGRAGGSASGGSAAAVASHGLAHVALVFGTNFREVHQPADYQTILPKRLIHRMLDAEPQRFFAEWRVASDIGRSSGAMPGGRREQWARTAEVLRERFGWPVDQRRRLLARGFMALGTQLDGDG
jgi:SAM-dependent methyltransferase